MGARRAVPWEWTAGAVALACWSGTAHPARPFVTDDARIVDPGQCQVESFAKRLRRRDESEVWILPGCNVASAVEITAGGFRVSRPGDADELHGVLQAKTLLRSLEPDGLGLAVSAGAEVIRRGATGGAIADTTTRPYVNLLASRAFSGDGVVIHANAGAARDGDAARSLTNWGLGVEVRLTHRLSLIGEGYGITHEGWSRQGGVRYWIRSDRLQVDTTIGTRAAHGHMPADRWVSAGVRWIFDAQR